MIWQQNIIEESLESIVGSAFTLIVFHSRSYDAVRGEIYVILIKGYCVQQGMSCLETAGVQPVILVLTQDSKGRVRHVCNHCLCFIETGYGTRILLA